VTYRTLQRQFQLDEAVLEGGLMYRGKAM